VLEVNVQCVDSAFREAQCETPNTLHSPLTWRAVRSVRARSPYSATDRAYQPRVPAVVPVVVASSSRGDMNGSGCRAVGGGGYRTAAMTAHERTEWYCTTDRYDGAAVM
jgi:hypothetical protein